MACAQMHTLEKHLTLVHQTSSYTTGSRSLLQCCSYQWHVYSLCAMEWAVARSALLQMMPTMIVTLQLKYLRMPSALHEMPIPPRVGNLILITVGTQTSTTSLSRTSRILATIASNSFSLDHLVRISVVFASSLGIVPRRKHMSCAQG